MSWQELPECLVTRRSPTFANPTHGKTRRIFSEADAILGVDFPSQGGCWLPSSVWGDHIDHTGEDGLPCRHSSSHETKFLYKRDMNILRWKHENE